MNPTTTARAAVDEVEWLTIAQAAERIGVSERQVYRYADDPAVPLTRHTPLPGLVRLRADEVEALRKIRLGAES